MPRFVVLRHEFSAGQAGRSHWDLMFERGDALRTWSLESDPASALDAEARALDDHRRAYLDYEGPVSGDRGSVTRWDAGEYRLDRDADSLWIATLVGERLRGQITIGRAADGHSWRVSFAAEPIRG